MRAVKAFLIIIVVAISSTFVYFFHEKSGPFYGDALGYYLYLPATFIYNNHTSIYEEPANVELPSSVTWYLDQQRREAVKTPKGYSLNQYTYGVALLESPFFLTAHLFEKITGRSATGYSSVYENAIKISSAVYAVLGLMIVFLLLRRFYSYSASLLAVLLLFIGTNMFWFSVHQAGMSHVPLLFLYALLMWLTVRLHDSPRWYYFALAAFVGGLITIIRPTDIICLLLPLLYNVYNKESLLKKWEFLKEHRQKIFLAALFFLLPILPQLLYWKMVTGSYVFYSYGGQEFHFLHPKLKEGLFGGQNGWLAYSPLMYFSIIGFLLCKRYRPWMTPLFVIFPLYVYIIYSWFCFNYINGFGSRPMLHLYPLLALPLAAVIQYVSEKRLVLKLVFGLLCLFFIAVNLSFSVQQVWGILRSEESNNTYNRRILFKSEINYNDLIAYDSEQSVPDTTTLKKIKAFRCYDFEDSTTTSFEKDTTGKSKFVYHIREEEFPEPSFSIPYSKSVFKDARWIKVSGDFVCPSYQVYYKHLFVVEVRRGDKGHFWRKATIDNKIGYADASCEHKELKPDHYHEDRWGPVYSFIKLPNDVKEGDEIKVFIWNIGKQELMMDNVCIDLYE